ncbi:DUF5686 and carboxypeptidase regulatory-like domain-containing protein [Runella slithyformis]|uniref:Carboxypeptidase-like regulatory domain-containing protein n=1 Tax=Runella slithyformis (strain ATCC 29530 / DSM 19594 / LMG 11500 / NCIMB 11436 / LSU 4) TaxID=761193 RepID=A0A7U3ZL96_RUNSL|nr:DUF5686 and carboxypeptidase regulatory-like domain-containing protein [Runella slithyformis]AEI49283.1 hypothetical protein Runsl_2895 [Runella slithyformis DSM 19594]
MAVYRVLFLLLWGASAFAGGIKGVVKTAKGEPLAYAAIAVKGTNLGTMANADGRYELALSPGRHEIVFQYLGFKSLGKVIEVAGDFQTLDATLEEQALDIHEVKIGSKSEDPAYTIMRRAIAKARFHALQVSSYSARAYIKTTGVITNIPFFLEKTLKKEGVEEGRPILNESVNEITFRQPNNYRQRVISTRNSMDNSAPSPNAFVLASFYDPTVGDAVSPLSPKAFGYYKFEYEGSFREGDLEVNRIKVIPRSYGEGVFKGQIYIIENTWAIHSLNLQTTVQSFDVDVKQVFTPVQQVWMPTNLQFRFGGSMMGFTGEFKYIISMTYKNLAVNPAFKESVTVLDEKFEQPANDLAKKDLRTKKLNELAKQQKEVSTKQMRRIMKEYEKQERQERKAQKEDLNVVRNDSIIVDSMANKRSDTFWNEIRTIPLTEIETKSYRHSDSLRIVKQIAFKADSSKAKKDSTKVNFISLLTGRSFKLSKKWVLDYEGPFQLQNATYNTVDGYVLESSFNFKRKFNRTDTYYVKPLVRYAFGRQAVSGTVTTGWNGRRRGISLTGGRYVSQFNADNPITANMNTTATLWFEHNFMKLYEKDFGRLSFNYARLADVFSISGNLEYGRRYELSNLENARPWIRWNQFEFTPNAPFNQEYSNKLAAKESYYRFETHDALTLNVSLTWRPGQQYSILNGRKRYLNNKNPSVILKYSKGIPNIANSAVDYDLAELSLKQDVQTGVRSELHYTLSAGAFLNNRSLYFMDYKHFMGNQAFVQYGDAFSQFRALNYYRYSTSERFLEAHVVNESRRLLLTRIPLVRLAGLKENLMVHYLLTPTLPHYTELGYGLDGLIPGFPFFRAEAVAVFQDFKYQRTVFRIGTTLKFGGQ